MSEWFQRGDKNQDGRMSFGEAQRLLLLMNVEMDQDYALRLFQVRLLGGICRRQPDHVFIGQKAPDPAQPPALIC